MSRRNSKHSKPRPKVSQSEPQTARAEAAVVPDPELVIAHRPDEFFGGQADERQLSLLMGDWRKGQVHTWPFRMSKDWRNSRTVQIRAQLCCMSTVCNLTDV